MTKEIEFSVILPIYHGGSFLRNALASLHQIDYPTDRFEVLVAGHDGDQESRQITEAESNIAEFEIVYIGCINSKRSTELNAACAVARGRVLAFADDDCIFFSDWLHKLKEVFQREPDAGIVGGQDELIQNASAFDLALDCALNSRFGTGGLRHGTGSRVGKYYPRLWNMAIPHEITLQVAFNTKEGLPQVFNESLIVHEDVDLANRVKQSGKRIVFAPEVHIRHCRDTTLPSFVRKNFNMAHTCRNLGVHRLPHVMLAIFVIGTLALVISSIFLKPAPIILLICMGIYILTLFAIAAAGFKRTRRLPVLVIIPLLLTSLHIARGLGHLFPWCNKSRERIYL